MGNQPEKSYWDRHAPADAVPAEELADQLHKRYSKLVYYFFQIYNLPQDVQGDLYNQIFLKILNGLKRIRHRNNLKSWVVTIAKNEIFAWHNRTVRERELLDVLRAGSTGKGRSREPTPERQQQNRQLQQVINEAVTALPDEISEPFTLRYHEGLSWRSVADACGLNVDAARKRALKARLLVKQHIRRIFGDSVP